LAAILDQEHTKATAAATELSSPQRLERIVGGRPTLAAFIGTAPRAILSGAVAAARRNNRVL
jgi:hypothetical protein